MIDLVGVSKRIRGEYVLRDIDVHAEEGAVTCLVGPNGSGKSMALRVMTGLMIPSSGKVLVGGKELCRKHPFPSSVGFMIENPAFLDAYSASKNLDLIFSVSGSVSHGDIAAVLDRVGLDPMSKKHFGKFSLGMKQRLGIAAAIFGSPDVILLDEPTNALDPLGVDLAKRIVDEERKRGATVVIATHDMALVDDVADRAYSIFEGRAELCE